LLHLSFFLSNVRRRNVTCSLQSSEVVVCVLVGDCSSRSGKYGWAGLSLLHHPYMSALFLFVSVLAFFNYRKGIKTEEEKKINAQAINHDIVSIVFQGIFFSPLVAGSTIVYLMIAY
jgi:hypothetical protein